MANYGSVCSGIEAASVAWHSLGWRAAWLAEIEPFPAAVLLHHYPDVPNYGDMTALAARVRELEIEAPDVLVGGTPCQAFSVAGLRQSLHDDRGQLTLKFLELADAIDTVRRTRGEPECIIVWENVPGVLNTKDNAFGCFLAGLAGESEPLLPAGGRWTDAGCVYGPTRTVAWRVLDAQYFGLAQRRRRVFVVASARNNFDPAAVLFEFDGVRRDTAPSREAGKVAPTIPARSTGGGGLGTDFDCDGGVITMAHGQGGESGVAATQDRWLAAPVPVGTDCYNGAITGDVAATIGTPGSSVNASGPTVMQPIAFSRNDFGGDSQNNLSPTMRVAGNAGGMLAVAVTAAVPVAFEPGSIARNAGPSGESVLSPTLRSQMGDNQPAVRIDMQVRRLTPVECERLQGFPDGYTAIPWRKKPASECPDGPRYKALGNSMAVPVMRWIGERIDNHLK
jgi:DNA (cytosine-5)-methyltransferase 1